MRRARAAYLRLTSIVALSAASFRNRALYHAHKNGIDPNADQQRATRFSEATISNDLVRAIGAHQFGSLPVEGEARQRVPVDVAHAQPYARGRAPRE